MKIAISEINTTLREMLRKYSPPLRIITDTESNLELIGNVEAMKGKEKVPGIYFASVITKPKDARFHFFPIYGSTALYDSMSDELRKSLKGKTCFHIKKLSPELEMEIEQMIVRGIEGYKKLNWIK